MKKNDSYEVTALRGLTTDCAKQKLRSVFLLRPIKFPISFMRSVDCVKLPLRGGRRTNESIDLNKFDQYYHHLFFYGMKKQKIAGTSHGTGFRNMQKHGIEGFIWINFSFWAWITWYEQVYWNGQGIYHQEYAHESPLFLLEESFILTLRFPNKHFFLGGVSSNQFSDFSIFDSCSWNQMYDPYIARLYPSEKSLQVKLKRKTLTRFYF
jgi:hypothetical protein